jgi:hypothetical protein
VIHTLPLQVFALAIRSDWRQSEHGRTLADAAGVAHARQGNSQSSMSGERLVCGSARPPAGKGKSIERRPYHARRGSIEGRMSERVARIRSPGCPLG